MHRLLRYYEKLISRKPTTFPSCSLVLQAVSKTMLSTSRDYHPMEIKSLERLKKKDSRKNNMSSGGILHHNLGGPLRSMRQMVHITKTSNVEVARTEDMVDKDKKKGENVSVDVIQNLPEILKELNNDNIYLHVGWKQMENRNAIQRIFTFSDFNEAWKFMSRSAIEAEEMNHHPEWFNVYNVVEVILTTHESNGVTQKDIDLARKMNTFANDIQPMRSRRWKMS